MENFVFLCSVTNKSQVTLLGANHKVRTQVGEEGSHDESLRVRTGGGGDQTW